MTTSEQRAAELAERRLADARADVRQLARQNEVLNAALRQAREQLVSLRTEIEALTKPPWSSAVLLEVGDEGAVVSVAGRVLRVAVAADLDSPLVPGSRVWLDESQSLVAVAGPDPSGEAASVVEVLDDSLLVSVTGESRDVVRSYVTEPVRAGDRVLVDRAARVATTLLPPPEDQSLVLDETPDATYADIGGLAPQLARIHDAVELPFVERERFDRYRLAAPRGVLLYGPPGCGKTMVAKAIAHSLAERSGLPGRGRFLSVKGPELLNKFVGETERTIRQVFSRAAERAADGVVVVFFDEVDALFRTRGSGVSSDVENTIVPALLAELDGVSPLGNVLVVGASNREDMIDPALLRPGRLDVKIRLDRPDRVAALDILARYLTGDLPYAVGETPEALAEAIVVDMYDESKVVAELTYADGGQEALTFAGVASGAMLANVVARAKRVAIKREIAGGDCGLTRDDVRTAVAEEFDENADLPATTNPDEWARVTGRRGERVVGLRRIQATG